MADKRTGLIVSSAPHVNNPVDTTSIMRDVLIALIPALLVAIYVNGFRALALSVVCVAACVIFEWAWQKFMHRPQTIGDLSAAVTGVILAFNMPVTFPFWMAVVGCFIAIVCVKQLFGGLGQNFANPAIVGRIALFIGFAGQMSNWTVTSKMSPVITGAAGVDAVAGPTPLGLYTQAVGINEKSARLNGIDPTFIKILSFVILGVCVSVAALIKVSRLSTINYSVIAKDIEMDAILAVA